jgi:DNA-binding NarL/FixJ family response regulator
MVVDDQKLLRESFKNIIENNSDISVAATAVNGLEAYELCNKINPDIILMDLFMPVCTGIEATKLIKEKYPSIRILILTASNDQEDAAEAIKCGADGYILKDIGSEQLILSIKSTFLGLSIIHKDFFNTHSLNMDKVQGKTLNIEGIEVSLSERDLKIISLLVEGKDNKEIGAALFIAEGTVKNTITEIISKLQLKHRTQLAVYAIKNHLV